LGVNSFSLFVFRFGPTAASLSHCSAGMPPTGDKKEMNKTPSMASLLVTPSTGSNVYRVQLRSAAGTKEGKFLSVELPSHLLVAKVADNPGPDSTFELHRQSDGRYALRSCFGKFLSVDDNIDMANRDKQGKDPGLKFDRELSQAAVAAAQAAAAAASSSAAAAAAAASDEQGDQQQEQQQQAVAAPQPDLSSASLPSRDRSFELVEVRSLDLSSPSIPASSQQHLVCLRASDDYFLAVEPGESKSRVVKNAVAAGYTAAMASAAAAANAAATAAAAAATAAAAAAAAPPSNASTAASAAATAAAAASAAAANAALTVAPPAPTHFAPSPGEVFQIVWLDDRSPFSLQGRAVLSTAHSKFLVADPSPRATLQANRSAVSLWEPLQIVPTRSLSHVAFQSVHGTFLTLREGGAGAGGTGELFFAGTDASAPLAQFEVVEVERSLPSPSSGGGGDSPRPLEPAAGRYAFRAANGRFLSALGNHNVVACAKQVGPWETFTLTPWSYHV
jgi:hypothetical protein